mgnify:CR=1 FL=1|tara:strand:+ start:30022 stop:30651 length:630 start_codon:yes stop_codon:yes gene_type:complete
MVNWSLITSPRSLVGCAVTLGLLLLSGCRTVNPVQVDASFVATPEFAVNCPTVLGVLPVEDGTESGSAGRHLTFFRQEVNRRLIDRGYSSTTENWVDASQIGAAPAGESILTPARLATFAKMGRDDGVLAIRIEKWDEGALMATRRVRFQIGAAMVASDGTQLWSGSIQGSVKAGGVGASPLGRDASARSCAELAVQELLLRLPNRIVQ